MATFTCSLPSRCDTPGESDSTRSGGLAFGPKCVNGDEPLARPSSAFATEVAERLEAAQRALAFEHEKVIDLIKKRPQGNSLHEAIMPPDVSAEHTLSAKSALGQARGDSANQEDRANLRSSDPERRPLASTFSTFSCASAASAPAQQSGTLGVPRGKRNEGIGSLAYAVPVEKTACGKTKSRVWELRPVWRQAHQNSHAGKIPCLSRVFEDNVAQESLCRRLIILHPNNYKRGAWDFLTMAMVLYDVVMIPFGLFEPQQSGALYGMAWVSRIFWTLDMWMSFTSGFLKQDGLVELRPYYIAKRYLGSWFVLDIVVVIIDWMEIFFESDNGLGLIRMTKASRVFRFVRMLRLVRLAKANAIIRILADRFVSEEFIIGVDLLKLVLLMTIVGHFLACVWFAIAKDAYPRRETWLETYGFIDETMETQYIISLRWALSQFSGGMDEVTPQSYWEHFYAAFCWLGAWWSGAAMLSSMTSHMTQIYTLRNRESQQLNAVKRYLKTQRASQSLCKRILRNAQYTLKMRKIQVDGTDVVMRELVSTALMTELHFEMYFPYFAFHPFFRQLVKNNAHVMRKACHTAMSSSFNSLDDAIFYVGEVAENMVMITSGTCEYSWGKSGVHEVVAGDWLAEHAIWTDWAHQGTLVVARDAKSIYLNAEAFVKIASQFEFEDFDPRRYAVNFLLSLNNLAEEEMTDLPIKGAVRADEWAALGKGKRFPSSLRRLTQEPATSQESETFYDRFLKVLSTTSASKVDLDIVPKPSDGSSRASRSRSLRRVSDSSAEELS